MLFAMPLFIATVLMCCVCVCLDAKQSHLLVPEEAVDERISGAPTVRVHRLKKTFGSAGERDCTIIVR